MSAFWDSIRKHSRGSMAVFSRVGNMLHWRRAVESIDKQRESRPTDPLFEETFNNQIEWFKTDLEKIIGGEKTAQVVKEIEAEAKRQVHEDGYDWFDTWED